MSHIVVHQSEYRDPWEERKPWNPLESAQYFHGYEITRHDDEANPPLDPKYRSKTARAYTAPTFESRRLTGPPRQRTPPAQLVENAFLATSEHADNFAWHEHYERPERPLPVPPQTETAWPNVSYHGRVPPGEKAFRDAIIEKEEERAWRTEGKVLPERMHAYHGEDEAKAVGKEPLSVQAMAICRVREHSRQSRARPRTRGMVPARRTRGRVRRLYGSRMGAPCIPLQRGGRSLQLVS